MRKKTTRNAKRRGVVLLVVLGMLSLFSVLVVSYVVFSSQMDVTSASNARQSRENIDVTPVIENAFADFVLGTNDPHSAAYSWGLLEDLYGVDGLRMRVGHRRLPSASPPTTAMPINPADARGALLRPLNASNLPQTTLFKFPTSLVEWFDDGSIAPGGRPIADRTNIATLQPSLEHRIDDVFSGRLVTFSEGPLQGVTFRIVRSFGTDNGTMPVDVNEAALAGNLVVDLSEMPTELINVDGRTEPLYIVAANTPNRLLYSPGPDGLPGRAGVDDDSNSITDDFTELGYGNSDDVGFQFVVNGRPFNGRGQNPEGADGLTDNRGGYDPHGHLELQFNGSLMGPGAVAGSGVNEPPQQDERWDAPDWENLFLAWLPSDHRRSLASVDTRQEIYSGIVGASELNRQLGQHIIPSFHRPAVINYLMNAPIRLPTENAASPITRTFAELDNMNAANNDVARLQWLCIRLRRATMRPLNFEHTFFGIASSDLDGDGDPYDGAPAFSGSNPTPILSEPLQTDSASFAQLKAQVARLATWLINGPWDVDNDNDGVPDSVWVDMNQPAIEAPDGRLIRPMVAPLIVDLDGRININVAGNYGQLITQHFRTNNPTSYSSNAEYFETLASLGVFGHGGGLGPAEIDFSHLFDEVTPSPVAPLLGPLFITQTSGPFSNVLLTRYGNLLNTRYGGLPYNYVAPYPTAGFTALPGNGSLLNAQAARDQFARIPFASRELANQAFSVMGRPIDSWGRSITRKDRHGHHRFTNLRPGDFPGWGNEIANQPYETGIDGTLANDNFFTPDEFADFIQGGELNGRLSQLLEDVADNNESLRRLLTTESRSLDIPEIAGDIDVIHLFSRKLSMLPAQQQVHLDRMLGIELRKGSKLNLNRPLSNGSNDTSASDLLTDETAETETRLLNASLPNQPNNVGAAQEAAFPQIVGEYPAQSTVRARYAYSTTAPNSSSVPTDYNGLDTNNDGTIDSGHDFSGDGAIEKVATANELLARHLYCLMFFLITPDPTASPKVPNFPYPDGFDLTHADRFVARRLAQWAVNAVDYRDSDPINTRLRYDPDPFDGFDLGVASSNVVWGMERPEIEVTENINLHDKRLRRNLDEATFGTEDPNDEDPGGNSDSDMDQFRIPEPTSYVELRAVRSPITNNGEDQPTYPRELYSIVGGTPRLDLGRIVGAGNRRSPVYRLAVGQPTGDHHQSTRWVFDAERVGQELVINQARPEELAHLFPGPVANVPTDVSTELTTSYRLVAKHVADVRHSLSGTDEYVTISDDDVDPTNDGTSDYRVRLDRFVWFARLRPDRCTRDYLEPCQWDDRR